MSDNPLENSTLAQFGKIEQAGPYVYVCRNGKDKIEFPDMTAMEWDEAEEFMHDIQRAQRKVWMPKYLGTEDLERFEKEKLTFGEAMVFMRSLSDHYEAFFGSQGEGLASRP